MIFLVSAQRVWYKPSNTLVIATGNINHNEFVAAIGNHVQHIQSDANTPSFSSHRRWDDEADKIPSEREIIIERPQREKAIICFGAKVPFYTDEKMQVKALFFEFMVCRGTSSRLWRELREKRGLIYTMSGGMQHSFTLGHHFSLLIETLPQRVREVKERVMELLDIPVTDLQLFREVQEWLHDHYTLSYEDIRDWAGLIFGAIVRDNAPKRAERSFQRALRHIDAMTMEEVEHMRHYIIRPEHMVTVVMQPC